MSTVSQSLPLAGIEIPAIGFGTYLIDPKDAGQAVGNALAIGYRHVDTAEVYQNESGVGDGLRDAMASGIERQDLFVTTKLWPGNAAWGEQPKSGAHTRAAFDTSLQQLGLDYVDLYLIHAPLSEGMRLDQWAALLEIKKSGKARAVGVSNYGVSHLNEIIEAGLSLPDANQIELHPWSQKPETIAFMAEHKIAPIAYSSLAPLSTWRAQPGQDSAKTDAMRKDTSALSEIALRYGVSEAQLLLRWGVQNGYAVLPKSLDPQRMKQNLDLFGFNITDDDMTLIATMDRGPGIAWQTGDPSLTR